MIHRFGSVINASITKAEPRKPSFHKQKKPNHRLIRLFTFLSHLSNTSKLSLLTSAA
ncbi:hypothetical protein HanIR_Chr16g0830401 [Helianthus annuus]|nr:hypothetical protein HanIR_Chr16g0830401 [Helianthus annuus]